MRGTSLPGTGKIFLLHPTHTLSLCSYHKQSFAQGRILVEKATGRMSIPQSVTEAMWRGKSTELTMSQAAAKPQPCLFPFNKQASQGV